MNPVSPPPSAKQYEADFRAYVIASVSPFRNLLELELLPTEDSRRGRTRHRRALVPLWLGPLEDLGPGVTIRFYGCEDKIERGGLVWPVRGLDVAGEEIFYRPLADTVEGWWSETSSHEGHEDELLYRYCPPRWRTLLPGAPEEVSLTRRCLTVKVRGSSTEDVFSLYDYLSAYREGILPLGVRVFGRLRHPRNAMALEPQLHLAPT